MTTTYTDILIIGAGPAGLVAANTASENYPDKKIILLKEFEKNQVPCGIPYVFGPTLGSVEKNAMPCGAPVTNVQVIVDTATKVDINTKTVASANTIYPFDKLIFATGSLPFVHASFQDAMHLENVFSINKSYENIDYISGFFEGFNRHPSTIPDAAKQSVKLIAMKNSANALTKR